MILYPVVDPSLIVDALREAGYPSEATGGKFSAAGAGPEIVLRAVNIDRAARGLDPWTLEDLIGRMMLNDSNDHVLARWGFLL